MNLSGLIDTVRDEGYAVSSAGFLSPANPVSVLPAETSTTCSMPTRLLNVYLLGFSIPFFCSRAGKEKCEKNEALI